MNTLERLIEEQQTIMDRWIKIRDEQTIRATRLNEDINEALQHIQDCEDGINALQNAMRTL